MKLPDWLTGSLLLALALAVLWHVRSFPAIPGQEYGAAVFPGLAASGMALAALVLIVGSLRRRNFRPSARPSARPGAGPAGAASPPATPSPDASSSASAPVNPPVNPPMGPRQWLALGLSVGSIVFYILAADALGFIPAGFLILAAMMWAHGARPGLIVPVALAATLIIHTGFYKLLRVPLPWGLLQPIAW